ncbi:phage tail protein [Paenibacillus nitricinens]|uniref:phage tail protein n=1 Tax=Paenibacillus nitricinens TaxID=3367691 RepID=UPI003F8303F6
MSRYLQSYDRHFRRIGILNSACDITRTRRINADYTMTFAVPMTSDDFRDKLPLKGHVKDERGQYYVINSRKRSREDRKLTAQVTCSHVMFKLADYKVPYTSYIREAYGIQISQLTTLIGAATNGRFSFAVDDTFDLVDVKDFGGGNCLEALNAVLTLYGAEVVPDNFTLHLRKKIGNANADYRVQLTRNLISASLADDVNSLCTRLYCEMKDSRTWVGQSADILTADERARLSAIPGAITDGILRVNYLVSQYAALWASDSVPYYDDVITEQDVTDPLKLLAAARLRLAEREVPSLEVSVSAADLFKLDKNEARPELGDTVTLVDPELGLDGITARITEMVEYPYAADKHTQLTVANVMKRDFTQILADLESSRRTIDNVFSGGRIRAEVFEEFARLAVNEINASKTEIKYDERGIVLQSKTDPSDQVILTSNGLILTTDGGATARTAITATGISAEVIAGQLGSFVSMVIGAGNNVVKINTNGISAGHDDFNSAPFHLDMEGNVVLNKLTANSAYISTSNLNASTWKDGYFTGNITANGEITGGTITGALIRTGISGARFEVDSSGWRTYDAAGTRRIGIYADSGYGMSAITFDKTGGGRSGYINGGDGLFAIASSVDMQISAMTGSVYFQGQLDFNSAYSIKGLQMTHISGLSSALSNKADKGTSTSSVNAGGHNHGIPNGTQFKDVNGAVYTWSSYAGFTHDHVQQ